MVDTAGNDTNGKTEWRLSEAETDIKELRSLVSQLHDEFVIFKTRIVTEVQTTAVFLKVAASIIALAGSVFTVINVISILAHR